MMPLGVLGSGYVAPGTFDPSGISGAEFWWDASSITGKTDGQTLTPMLDNFGGASAVVISGYALYQTNELNGYPAAEFNGTNSNYLKNSGIHQLSPEQTHIFVCKPDDTADMRWMSMRTGTGYGFGLSADNKWGIYYNMTARLQADAAIGSWSVVSFVSSESANTFEIRVNGTSVAMATNSLNSSGTGQYYLFGHTLNSFDGLIAEVFRYTSALSTTDLGSIEGYLLDKYAL